jgi:hypothetical protein
VLNSMLAPHVLPARHTAARVNALRRVDPGETVTLADVAGPGALRHIFLSMPPRGLRDLVLPLMALRSPSLEVAASPPVGLRTGRPRLQCRSRGSNSRARTSSGLGWN